MDADTDASAACEVPLCKGCNHRHFQGIKCGICGHVGQSNLYSRMCEKAKTLGSYRVETQPHEVCEESADMYAISLELRRQTLCAEGVMSDDQDEFEGSSRCLVGYLGDLPIWTARWRFLLRPSGTSSSPTDSSSVLDALIDKAVVLPEYRHQHICSSSMEQVFADIQHTATQNNVSVSQILALVPLQQQSWIDMKLEARGFSTADKTVQCLRADVPYYHAILSIR